ncbi:NAD-glutamate dehydrogenase [Gammaproteobacteria bacterium SCGC AG-212-F23]|nr:NAD-glutamate dehydrogenase [Gammaproteobacteria bacterium SCGC AG-212-F23]
MAAQVENHRQVILDELCHYLKNRVPEHQYPLIQQYVPRYYASCALADLLERSSENLLGAFLSHWNYILQRQVSEVKVQVFNPTREKDGWESSHTIIQVSHDDIPFLVDSIRMEVNRKNLQIHFAIHLGGLKVIRDQSHVITEILPMGAIDSQATSEAPIYFEIDRINDVEMMETLRADIVRVLADVHASVVDWRKMVAHVEEALVELDAVSTSLDPADVAESKDFLRWIINNNFTFLGVRDYKLIGNDANRALQMVPGSGLGVLRDESTGVTSRRYADLPPQARKLALSKNVLIIAKTNTISTVHRMVYTDYIGVKRFNQKGELIGERRFIGLYTSTAYHSSPRQIPFLRHKVQKVVEDLHYPPDSHNGKEVMHILETLPRDDLFQATQEELLELTMAILQLQERKCIRLLIRKDSYNRFFSCLVYIPREIFTTELCHAMQDILMQNLHGVESSFSSYFSDSVLARVHFIVRINPKLQFDYDAKTIEKELISISRSWSDELKTQLIQQLGEAEGLQYFLKYGRAFPASYSEYYLPATAIDDIKKIETLTEAVPLGMIFYRAGITALRLKLFHLERTIALSDVMPIMENMGLRIIGERPHEIILRDGAIVWINDFDMVHATSKSIDMQKMQYIFQDAFAHVWYGHAENDGFNKLVLDAELAWNQVAVFRAYTKYLRQIGFTFSQDYIEQALINNPAITRNLFQLFETRFSPAMTEENRSDVTVIIAEIEKLLDAVKSLDEDRILRRILEVIMATIRTNFYQKNTAGEQKSYISFKLDPSGISDLPLPKPMYEIFVYSPRVEGVHLRGGKVARGGIRWSDRREDFRVEILGLMKAQQVKNSVIVPVGAKGGFYPKQINAKMDRDHVLKEAIDCYTIFIRGLLDLTDNIKDLNIVPPKDVVRYDEDDYYLVVAADKGTATFSDIANKISMEYDFWLGDAFASGGSAGYDHKKMGITARGAFESVKRHFRELEMNPLLQDFTVIGVGDMAGDVFGNGMLLSTKIKLVGAFNHLHIFLDPNPDTLKSFEERQRLFNLPRSSWTDYNPELISTGGGVFERSAKSIRLTPEIKAALGIEVDQMVPNDLIRAMLMAKVDLLWNGGIGTFVKSSNESHLDVGDRTNDGIRINGNELHARIAGEGGNLGFTQLGRIEYSLKGGILYTDFIDNSAGVDCSDHEVNIKILLNKMLRDNTLTLTDRNKLLEKMSDEVAELVLRDNYEQTQMLSLESSVATETIDLFRRYLSDLEKVGRLNRSLEFLPDEQCMLERKATGLGLTRPEIAVVLAYCKMYLKQDILETDVPDDPYFINYLMRAFPQPLHQNYLSEMKEHRLRREIIATQVGKDITDHMGIGFIERLQRETGASLGFVIRAYVIMKTVFQMDELWHQIEALDFKVNYALQQKMMLKIFLLVNRATRWFLRNRSPESDIELSIKDFAEPVAILTKHIPELLTEHHATLLQEETNTFVEQGAPIVLAKNIVYGKILFTSLDIVEASRKHGLDLIEVAKTYYALGSKLELDWLRDQIEDYTISNQWEELARASFRDDLDSTQRRLSVNVLTHLKNTKKKSIDAKIDYWLEENKFLLDRWQHLLAEVKSSANLNFVTYSVVLRELFDFSQAG